MNYDEIMKKMRGQYISSLQSQLTELKEKTFSEIENEYFLNFYHKLKGSGASYGIPEVSDFGNHYEQLIKKNEFTQNDLEESIKKLEGIINSFA